MADLAPMIPAAALHGRTGLPEFGVITAMEHVAMAGDRIFTCPAGAPL